SPPPPFVCDSPYECRAVRYSDLARRSPFTSGDRYSGAYPVVTELAATTNFAKFSPITHIQIDTGVAPRRSLHPRTPLTERLAWPTIVRPHPAVPASAPSSPCSRS